MRRLTISLAVVSLLLAAGLLFRWPGARARQAERLPAPKAAKVAQPRMVGVAGCAAASCHHGNSNGETRLGAKGSEYSTWMARDPHARAYQALFKPESKRMHENMQKDSDAYKMFASAHENKLCLKCHGMGPDEPAAMQGDGVGCERCHGPAGRWKTTHYQAGFDRATPGFVDTRDLLARAKTCMKCHVGDDDQEVNHDLIAAGHPRLRFEFAAFYASYPRHWADFGEKTADPGFEARAWVVGQLMTAQSSLELLASRAKVTDPSKGDGKPWPEFAEYECASCHRGLRKGKDFAKVPAQTPLSAGGLPYGTWYNDVLARVARELAPGRGAALGRSFDSLSKVMSGSLSPDRDQVGPAAEALAGKLSQMLDGVKAAQFDEARVDRLMKALAECGPELRGWDGGTQVYLGLAAMHNAKCDLNPAFQARSPLHAPLLRMRKTLRDSFGKGRPLYDSPLKYDADLARQDLKKIRQLLK
jgi:hypothetical protein